jgi:hypothetical protein
MDELRLVRDMLGEVRVSHQIRDLHIMTCFFCRRTGWR